MLPIVKSHLRSLLEDIRLLEILVTSPLGLYSDIKMLREALPMADVEDLERDEQRQRRTATAGATTDISGLAMTTVASAISILDTFERFNDSAGAPLNDEWIQRARRVLGRAADKVSAESRNSIVGNVAGVYVIVDPEFTRGRSIEEVAGAALKGGASVIQLRDKISAKQVMLDTAANLKSLCDANSSLLIINDYTEIAMLSEASGVHLGDNDLLISDARRVITANQLIGRSSNNLDQALQAQAAGADYIAVGPVFATDTMGKDVKPPIGLKTVKEVKDSVTPPLVAIGGINASNAASVFEAGADAICIASAITLSENPEDAAREIVNLSVKA